MDDLKFFRRRQFILGSRPLAIQGWSDFEIRGGYYLAAHPELPIYRAERADLELTLLGYMVDPCAPCSGEAALLADMLACCHSLPDIIRELERQSGRFVLVVSLADGLYVLHDAAGLRQVVYCRDPAGATWCASQADHLAAHWGYALDESVRAYAAAPLFLGTRNEFWLGHTRTAYKEIRQLLPNHYLDLKRGDVTRFWPRADSIRRRSVGEAIALTTPILKNSIMAMSQKHDLKMGVTAGLDSRKTLAASRDVKGRLTYFTIEHGTSARTSVDVKIAARLLRKLGLDHQVFPEREMESEFKRLYTSSVTLSRESKGRVAYTLYANLGPDCTILSSNASEITQCNYWLPKSYLSGEGLAIITGLYHSLMISDFAEWLREAREACEVAKLDVLTLFHWEQRVGRWAAAGFSEYDIVHESFTPYDNRLLNSLLLGVSDRYRRDRMRLVGIRQVRALWPELLDEPINPGETVSARLKDFVRRGILHRLVTPWIPLYEFVKFQRKKREARKRGRPGTLRGPAAG